MTAEQSRSIAFSTVVGPSRWWELLAAAEDVPHDWGDATYLIHATSDDGEQITATHVDAAKRSIAGWDGDLERLEVVREQGDPEAGAYRVDWTFQRGSAPRVNVTGPDANQVSTYASSVHDHVAPRMEAVATEDAQPVPPGDPGRIWPKLDTLGTVIAVGISVVVVLAVAGAVWAWWSAR